MWLLNAKNNDGEFEQFKGDLDAVERKVAGEFDPGARALVVAILVFLLLVSFLLPHTGSTKGFDVLVGNAVAINDGVSLPSRVFTWLALVFSVGFSVLALLTRRWALAWVALAGSAVASALGMLAVWSRQTAGQHPGPGYGLIIAWLTVIVLTFHWARVVWARTAMQLAAEAQRRDAAARRQRNDLLDGLDGRSRPSGPDEPGKPDDGNDDGTEDKGEPGDR
ncbi:Rv2732c family membrane protein [Mycolicibacterium goodii]|uniref:Rv2732c family membrane protein n=1 Tax=Mycolicibacterium goodii TaxID=134601 RepID=UPI00093C925A|nr:hypothetical protein [Mycolicibacterium goodii]OKH75059.1 membrane protein [Mycobacterium sp. SWH-M5]